MRISLTKFSSSNLFFKDRKDVFAVVWEKETKSGTTQVTTQIGTQVTTQKISEKILKLLKRHPAMSRRKLAEVLGDITEDGNKYHLEKLKEERKLERIGGTRRKMIIILNQNSSAFAKFLNCT